jgi:hypothetical protein
MNTDTLSAGLLAALLLAASGAAQAAEVKVEFKDPDKFVDAGHPGTMRDRNFKELTAYLQKLGEKLPATQQLTVEFLDLNLAGEFEPWRNPQNNDIRYMREVTWPSARLHFVLSENGKTITEGEDSIADMSYQSHSRSTGSSSSLYYDEQLLETWFKKRFIAADKKS